MPETSGKNRHYQVNGTKVNKKVTSFYKANNSIVLFLLIYLVLTSCSSNQETSKNLLCTQGDGLVEVKNNGTYQEYPFSLKKTRDKVLVGIEMPLIEEVFFIKKDGAVSKNFEKFTLGHQLPRHLLKKVARWFFNLFEGQKLGGGELIFKLPSNIVIKFEPTRGNKGSFVVRLMRRVVFINSSYGQLAFKFSSCDKISRF